MGIFHKNLNDASGFIKDGKYDEAKEIIENHLNSVKDLFSKINEVHSLVEGYCKSLTAAKNLLETVTTPSKDGRIPDTHFLVFSLSSLNKQIPKIQSKTAELINLLESEK
ncbi:hypothetical protein KY347_06975 [Candidatus Woesearchaeota archaeon]|nr:hypothetical protein [Candidatus Woesearchaeota archaeon]